MECLIYPIACGSPATVPEPGERWDVDANSPWGRGVVSGVISEARGVHFGVRGDVFGVILEVRGVVWAAPGAIGTSFRRSRPTPGPDGEKVVKKSVRGPPRTPLPGSIFGTFFCFFASFLEVVFEGAFGRLRDVILDGFWEDLGVVSDVFSVAGGTKRQ